MCQSVNLSGKIVVQNAGSVLAYCCATENFFFNFHHFAIVKAGYFSNDLICNSLFVLFLYSFWIFFINENINSLEWI